MDGFWQSAADFFMGVAWLFILANMTYHAFEYFCGRVALLDPGSQIGIGVGGFIGLVGFFLGYLDGTRSIAACLFGACIGSGMYRFNEDPQVQINRARGIHNLKAIGC